MSFSLALYVFLSCLVCFSSLALYVFLPRFDVYVKCLLLLCVQYLLPCFSANFFLVELWALSYFLLSSLCDLCLVLLRCGSVFSIWLLFLLTLLSRLSLGSHVACNPLLSLCSPHLLFSVWSACQSFDSTLHISLSAACILSTWVSLLHLLSTFLGLFSPFSFFVAVSLCYLQFLISALLLFCVFFFLSLPLSPLTTHFENFSLFTSLCLPLSLSLSWLFLCVCVSCATEGLPSPFPIGAEYHQWSCSSCPEK